MKKNQAYGRRALSKNQDFPLNHGSESRLLPWIIGFMIYVASLALVGAIALTQLSHTWEESLSSSMTIQVLPNDNFTPTLLEKRTQKVTKALRGMPTIKAVSVLTDKQSRNLLKPWIGDIQNLEDLPIPRVISIKLLKKGIDKKAFEASLSRIDSHLSLDTHQAWRVRFVDVLKGFRAVAMVVIIGMVFTVGVIVVFVARGGLRVHKETIRILHLIGASDHYISKQFQKYVSLMIFIGGVGGAFASLVTILIIGYSLSHLVPVASYRIPLELIGIVVIFPFIMTILGFFVARWTVLKDLRKTL